MSLYFLPTQCQWSPDELPPVAGPGLELMLFVHPWTWYGRVGIEMANMMWGGKNTELESFPLGSVGSDLCSDSPRSSHSLCFRFWDPSNSFLSLWNLQVWVRGKDWIVRDCSWSDPDWHTKFQLGMYSPPKSPWHLALSLLYFSSQVCHFLRKPDSQINIQLYAFLYGVDNWDVFNNWPCL